MANVILYCRVSSDEQAENTSLGFQEDSLRRYCERMNYNVVAVYREDYSAKHYDLKRPEMGKMYNYCKSHRGSVNKILFLRWDRYSRNVGFAFEYQRKFSELGIEINAIESPIDFRGTEWAMMLSVYCGVAHAEDNKISKRTKDGIRATLKAGRYPQKAPIGYRNHRSEEDNVSRLELDNETAPIVAKVFNEMAEGMKSVEMLRHEYSPLLIRRRREKHNDGRGHIIDDVSGRPISKGAFYRMLRNRLYCGDIIVPASNDEPQQIVEGIHEAIVSRDTFNKVQDILDGRMHKTKTRKTDNPALYLRRYLVCPECNHGITGGFSRGNGGVYAYYNCCCCKKVKARAERANEAFEKFIGSLKPTPEARDLYELIKKDVSEEGKVTRKTEIGNINVQLSSTSGKIAKADDMLLEGSITKEQHQRMCVRLEQEKAQLEERLKALNNPQSMLLEPKLSYAYSLIDNLSACLREAPVNIRCHIIGSIFPEKIEFDGSKYRTTKINEFASFIFQNYKDLLKQEQDMESTMSRSVPRAGVEPARSSLSKRF